jgi:hypothetical protein
MSAHHSEAAQAEMIRGINEPLPAGERVLWQGAPHWWALACGPFHVRKVGVYFALLLVWRVAAGMADGASFVAATTGSGWLALLALIGIGLLTMVAWLSSRTTIYAITTGRVVMRIGIALPIFVNLPLRGIQAAALKPAYAHLWPHARPWRLAHPQPMLRGVPGAAAVAHLLSQTLAAEHGLRPQWSPPAAARPGERTEPTAQPTAAAA